MKKFLFNSIISKQPPKGIFIETIWESRHHHLHISILIGIGIDIGIAKILFLPSEFSFLKNRILMFFPVLSYGISTTLLQMGQKGFIGVLEKGNLNFRKDLFIGVSKK